MVKSIILLIYYFFYRCNCSKVVWLSIDAFSSIFINEYNTPTIIELIAKGTSSLKVSPVFPSLTFPNHQAQVTGLYTENHGVVNYEIKIPLNAPSEKYIKDFKLNSLERIWWDPSENMRPIFTANEIADKNHRSSCIFWPGDSVNYSNHQISKFESTYDPTVGFAERIDRAIADMPNYNLINVYVSDIDMDAHKYGPYSSEVNIKVKLLDASIKKLKEVVEKEKDTNLIITSDHGMAEVIEDLRESFISQFNISNVEIVNFGAVVTMYPVCGQYTCDITPEEIVSNINKIPNKKFIAYLKKDVPTNLHYSHNDRIPPIIVIMDNGYIISDGLRKDKGDHGWPADNFSNMSAIFIAIGPSFYENRTVDGLKNVDFYGMVCKILDIEKACHPHNGSMELINIVLEKEIYQKKFTLGIMFLIIFIIIILVILFFVTNRKNFQSYKISLRKEVVLFN